MLLLNACADDPALDADAPTLDDTDTGTDTDAEADAEYGVADQPADAAAHFEAPADRRHGLLAGSSADDWVRPRW